MQNSWALERLARFYGKTVRIEIPPFAFACTILSDGSLCNADAATSADAQCVIAPSLLPRLALQDEKAHAEIRSNGDPGLLTEIFYLSRNIRWDAAADLSRITGDIAAERIVRLFQSAHRQMRESALNLSKAAAEYWTEERPLLAKPQQVSAFMQQVDTLRDDVSRLEQRIRRFKSSSAREIS